MLTYLGGYSVGDPPLSIPNREVKPDCADGTAVFVGEQVAADFQEGYSFEYPSFLCAFYYICRKINMKKVFVLYLLTLSLVVSAKDWVKICGEERYVVPENVSLRDAKNEALMRAKANALAERFGTIIHQGTTSVIKENNVGLNEYFIQTTGQELRGEWIEDIGQPIYRILFENEMQIVEVSICGKARERKFAEIDFVAKVMRNDTDNRSETEKFQSGDAFYLYFRTPIKGYLSVYLIDENQQATCLLPYQHQSFHSVAVDANTDYVFFSLKESIDNDFVDEYILTANDDVVQNQLYIIFSPNEFVKANDEYKTSNLRELSFADFQTWLTKNRVYDEKMQVIRKVLTITK